MLQFMKNQMVMSIFHVHWAWSTWRIDLICRLVYIQFPFLLGQDSCKVEDKDETSFDAGTFTLNLLLWDIKTPFSILDNMLSLIPSSVRYMYLRLFLTARVMLLYDFMLESVKLIPQFEANLKFTRSWWWRLPVSGGPVNGTVLTLSPFWLVSLSAVGS